MDAIEAMFVSWDRQCRILDNIAALVDGGNRKSKPHPERMTLDMQLCHVHETRYWWLGQTNKEFQGRLGDVVRQDGDDWVPVDDLGQIRDQLRVSGQAVKDCVEDAVAKGIQPLGGYDHPVLFLEHMVWHEGWHVGQMMLCLVNAGQEPSDEWEEANVWGLWRTEL